MRELTLEVLSARSGVSVSSLSDIELGRRGASPETLEAIVLALSLSRTEAERVVRIAMSERTEDFREILQKVAS